MVLDTSGGGKFDVYAKETFPNMLNITEELRKLKLNNR
jgi:hypothetical protein